MMMITSVDGIRIVSHQPREEAHDRADDDAEDSGDEAVDHHDHDRLLRAAHDACESCPA